MTATLLYLRSALGVFCIIILALVIGWLRHKAVRGSRLAVLVAGLLSCFPLVAMLLEHFVGWPIAWLRIGAPWITLLPATVGLGYAYSLTRNTGARLQIRQLLASCTISLTLLTLGLAVAETQWGHKVDRMAAIILVDQSSSISQVPGARGRVEAELKLLEMSMRSDDQVAVVVFGGNATLSEGLHRKLEQNTVQSASIMADATDLEAAIRRGLAEVPAGADARLIVISDGVQTRGDALAAAVTAETAGIPIDVVALEQKRASSTHLLGVSAPALVNEGAAVDFRIEFDAAANEELTLQIAADDEDPSHPARVLTRKANAGHDTWLVRQIAPAAGLHKYTFRLSSPSSQPNHENERIAFMRVRGQSLALIFSTHTPTTASMPIEGALRETGMRASTVGIANLPTEIAQLAGVDLVVLADVPAADVSESQMMTLASYVKDLGGGLLLLGGRSSYGAGGYARTSVEEVSPVSFDLKREQRRASLAEVIAIDYSGSMGAEVSGRTKLSLANEAAARSADLLGPGDRLGVLHVDTVASWTFPINEITADSDVASRIRAVGVGGGGIYTDLALRTSYEALDAQTVNLKHTLLFADGDDAEQIQGCRALVSGAEKRGITTSVISLGHGHDTAELEVLSKLGAGRFYLIDDARKLPAVFTQETLLASKQAIREEPFTPSPSAPAPALRGIDWQKVPALTGYNVNVPKPRSATWLTGPDGDPILSYWSIGLGHSAAFASEYGGGWGASWGPSSAASQLFGQLARELARRGDDPRMSLSVAHDSGELTIHADASGRDPGGAGRQRLRNLHAHVAGPGGYHTDVPLLATSIDNYEATAKVARTGGFVVTTVDDDTGESLGFATTTSHAGLELAGSGSDFALLERIAALSHGIQRTTLENVFRTRGSRRFHFESITERLLYCALFCWVLSVLVRRLGMPEVVVRAVEAVRRRMAVWRSRRAVLATVGESHSTLAAASRIVGQRARAQAPKANERPVRVAWDPAAAIDMQVATPVQSAPIPGAMAEAAPPTSDGTESNSVAPIQADVAERQAIHAMLTLAARKRKR